MVDVNGPVEVSFQLQILADDTIIIPGCEPTSALSSATLSYSIALNGCEHPKIPVKLVLEKIPGTSVKYGWNFNLGYNQTWLVFPPYLASCPCPDRPDWYSMLRCIAKDIEEPVVQDKTCDVIDNDFCNNDIKPGPSGPQIDPYSKPPEGASAIGMGGILPPIPPWARKSIDFCEKAGMNKVAKQELKNINILDSILGS